MFKKIIIYNFIANILLMYLINVINIINLLIFYKIKIILFCNFLINISLLNFR